MDLQRLKSYLESIGHAPMVLDAADNALQEPLQKLLRDLPAQSLRIAIAPTGIALSGAVLTITGISTDRWNIPGPAGPVIAIDNLVLTIADTEKGITVTLKGGGVLHLSATASLAVAIASPEKADEWWTLTADPSGSESLGFSDVFHLGTVAASPVDVTSFEPLTGPVKVVRSSFLVRFMPSGITPAISTVTLHADTGWKIIPDILELNGIDVMLFMGNAALAFRIAGTFRIGSADLTVAFDISPASLWIATVRPVIPGKWPGIADLAEFVGGEELGTSIRDGLKSFGLDPDTSILSSLALGVDRHRKKIAYFDIATTITIKSIDLDIVLRLPDGEIRGGLREGTVLRIRDLLTSFGLEHTAVPEGLAISSLKFSAAPKVMVYSFAIALDGIWAAGPFQLQQIALYIAYFGADEGDSEVVGEISCTLAVGSATFHLLAEHEGRDAGWKFRGGMVEGSAISVKALVDLIREKFNLPPVPDAAGNLGLTGLSVAYDTLKGAFDFTCRGTFSIAGKDIVAEVTLAVGHEGSDRSGPYKVHTEGKLWIGTSRFTVRFDGTSGSREITVTWDATTTPLSFGDVARHFELDISGVPVEFLPKLSGASFSYDFVKGRLVFTAATEHLRVLFITQPGEGSGPRIYAASLGMAVTVSLADLPVVGKDLASVDDLGVNNVQVIVTSESISPPLATLLNTFIPDAPAGLPRFPAKGLDQGVMLAVSFMLAGEQQPPLAFRFGGGKKLAAAPAPSTTDLTLTATTSQAPAVAWLGVNRGIGPVAIARIGASFHDGRIWLLIDAGFALSGLSVALKGLSLGFTIKAKPEFAVGLDGLVVDYHGGPISIGGGLAAVKTREGIEYDGTVIIQAEKLNIAAIGSYSTVSDHPSMFIFAMLGADLGGPPYFHVTGLAAGFGYNRSLTIPALDKLPGFPLVAAAMAGETGKNPFAGSTDNASAALDVMRDYIAPAYGRHWLAAGVRFTSFEMIHSFALLSVAFGTSFDLSLLGLSTISIPSAAADPICYAELALVATFSPEKGVLAVSAQLTPRSYILSPDCHLTGGFAFHTWFRSIPNEGTAGDFVVTLGGYHPHFNIGYYPAVPRLGANWRLSDHMNIKGETYFALTPSTVMAGGTLDARWESGDLKAWFTVDANFLLAWKPFHYEADISLTIGASYTTSKFGSTSTITVQVGVSLSLWGPPFAGRAYVDLYVISFTILFPAGQGRKGGAGRISWNEFKGSFLPKPTSAYSHASEHGASLAAPIPTDTYCTITVAAGLIRDLRKEKQGRDGIDWVVHPDLIEITTRSVIPCNGAEMATTNGATLDLAKGLTLGAFGVGPVGVPDGALRSLHAITIRRIVNGLPDRDFDPTAYLVPAPLFNNVPKAAWSADAALDPTIAKLNSSPSTIAGALVGFTLTARRAGPARDPLAVSLVLLRGSVESVQPSFAWSAPVIPTSDQFDQKSAMTTLMSTIGDANGAGKVRDGILSALGAHGVDVDEHVDVTNLASSARDTLMGAPLLNYLGEYEKANGG
jgi:hypothetical protein